MCFHALLTDINELSQFFLPNQQYLTVKMNRKLLYHIFLTVLKKNSLEQKFHCRYHFT